jgi:dihydrofolate reductase
MRKLVYYVAVSIDGYIADPSGGFDAFLVDGDHAQVVFGEYADALPTHAHRALGIAPPGTRFDTVLMGWNTLTPALNAGISSPYAHLRQVVASRSPRDVDSNITLTDNPVAMVRSLKRENGLDIWLCGGGSLAAHSCPRSTTWSSSGIRSSSAPASRCSAVHRTNRVCSPRPGLPSNRAW